jgi:hypothetical protein
VNWPCDRLVHGETDAVRFGITCGLPSAYHIWQPFGLAHVCEEHWDGDLMDGMLISENEVIVLEIMES